MKKAEEWWSEFTKELKGINRVVYEVHKPILLDIIKKIQEDVLEYAVKKCAENSEAEIGYHAGDYGYPSVIVSEQSILKTIDEIKEELK